MCRPFILFNGLALIIWSVAVLSVTDWDFVLLRFEYNTSNADIINFDLRTIRVSPGVYAVNGSFFLNEDIDNTNLVSLKLDRSASGSSQFRATPFEIPKTTFYKFMTSIYIKMLQKDLLQCSNLPERKDSFEEPLPKGTYVFNKCIMSNDGMPGHVQPGVYRATGHLEGGSVELFVSVFFEVSLKLDRSASGSSQFRATPFEIPKTTFYKFMTSIYIKMLQKDLLQCSNLPERKDSFEEPLPKGTYVFNKCIMSNDGMPGHIQPGVYRATGHLEGGSVELFVSVFFEVNTKAMV